MSKKVNKYYHSEQVAINKRMANVIVFFVALSAILLLTSCVFMWKINHEVKTYTVKVKKLSIKADELIIEKEKIHKQKRIYIDIQGFIPREGVVVYGAFSNYGHRGMFVGYYKVENVGIQEFRSKDTLRLSLNESGSFVARIPYNKAFVSRYDPKNGKGISIKNREGVTAFLRNALMVKILMTRPPKHYIDSLSVDFQFRNLNDTLNPYRPRFLFSPIDSVNYDVKSKRYRVYISNRTLPPFMGIDIGLEVLWPPKNKMLMGIQ